MADARIHGDLESYLGTVYSPESNVGLDALRKALLLLMKAKPGPICDLTLITKLESMCPQWLRSICKIQQKLHYSTSVVHQSTILQQCNLFSSVQYETRNLPSKPFLQHAVQLSAYKSLLVTQQLTFRNISIKSL